MYSITLTQFIEKLNLKNHLPEIDTDGILIKDPDINRPAVQFSGFFEHFDASRIQICGNVEHAYITSIQDDEATLEIFDRFFSHKFPCLVFCRGLQPQQFILDAAKKYGVPVLTSEATTSAFVHETVRWLHVELAPRISIHAVLVDVYGVGVMIMGESGIGKSEAALELIKRGHRLVSDDVVEIKKVSDDTLVGTAPDITRHFIELRGIGIIDVKALFGVESILDTANIDMVIQLEEWDRGKDYDRLGLIDHHIDILGNQVISYNIPVRPGRNVAVIVESASVNHRQKMLGYNAAQELERRVEESFSEDK